MRKIIVYAALFLSTAGIAHAAPTTFFIPATTTPGCLNVASNGLLWSSKVNCPTGFGTNFFTNSGTNTFLNTGTKLQAPILMATSTTASSSIMKALGIGTTSPKYTLDIQSSTTIPTFGNYYQGINIIGGNPTMVGNPDPDTPNAVIRLQAWGIDGNASFSVDPGTGSSWTGYDGSTITVDGGTDSASISLNPSGIGVGIFNGNPEYAFQVGVSTVQNGPSSPTVSGTYDNNGECWYADGNVITSRLYAYRTINGHRLYSEYSQGQTFTDNTSGDSYYLTWSWSAASGGADGYFLTIQDNDFWGSYVNGIDVGNVTSFNDDGCGYTPNPNLSLTSYPSPFSVDANGNATTSNNSVIFGNSAVSGNATTSLNHYIGGILHAAVTSIFDGDSTHNGQIILNDTNGSGAFRGKIYGTTGGGSNAFIFNVGTDQDFALQPHIALSTGVAFAVVNDTNTVNLPVEWRSAGTQFSNITGAGVGFNTAPPTSDMVDVNGNIRLRSGLHDTNNSLGTNKDVLTTTGTTVTWTHPNALNLTVPLASTTGTLGVANGGTGATTFGQGWIFSTGGSAALSASTSPTVDHIVATSTKVASFFPYASSTAITINGGPLFAGANSAGTAGNILMSQGSVSNPIWVATSTAFANLPTVTTYNGTTTQGVGLIPEVFFASSTLNTGAITYGSYQPSATSTLMVGADVNILAVTTDVINYRISWTDEFGQAETINSSSLSSVGFNSIGPYTITAKGGTPITFATILTTGIGTISYNTRAWATKLQ